MARVIMASVACAVLAAAAAIGTWRFLASYTAQLATSPEWRSRTPAWRPPTFAKIVWIDGQATLQMNLISQAA